jgi:selenocysteine lyase/cysteine desulfurase
MDRIQRTIAERAAELRTRLDAAGMHVRDRGIARCGIVTFTHPSIPAERVAGRLRADRINTSTTALTSARADMESRNLAPMVRMSVHCTTTTDELDRAVTAIEALT